MRSWISGSFPNEGFCLRTIAEIGSSVKVRALPLDSFSARATQASDLAVRRSEAVSVDLGARVGHGPVVRPRGEYLERSYQLRTLR